MKYLFTAPSLTEPTYETLETQVYKAFAKIEKLVEKEESCTLRVSVNKDGDEFVVTVELINSGTIVSKQKDRNLRRAIDIVSHEIKSQLVKNKSKKGLQRMTERIKELRKRILNKNIE